MEDLAGLFIKEPSSLEVLLMLTDEGPKTIKDMSEEDTKITDLLDKLRRINVIDIKDDLIYITSYGKCLVKKLRILRAMENVLSRSCVNTKMMTK